MSLDTFDRALDFTARMEELAWKLPMKRHVLLSGGECSEHPDFVTLIEKVYERKMHPLLITNGSWLSDPETRKAVLRPEWQDLEVQVQNDPKFYPKRVPHILDSRILYRPPLELLLPLGRMANKKGTKGLPIRKHPTSFNMRSLTRSEKSFKAAVTKLRIMAGLGMTGACTPSISWDGQVRVGETTNCMAVGNVDSTDEDLTRNVINMGPCNRCGLEDNLDQIHKRAIGLSNLYAHNE